MSTKANSHKSAQHVQSGDVLIKFGRPPMRVLSVSESTHPTIGKVTQVKHEFGQINYKPDTEVDILIK